MLHVIDYFVDFIRDAFTMVWKKKWLLIAFCMVSVLVSYGLCKSQDPIYFASAKIVVSPRRRWLDVNNPGRYSAQYIQHFYFTQYILMHANKIYFAVIDALDLQNKLSPYSRVTLPREIALNWLKSSIQINFFEEANVAEIVVYNKDPFLAAEIANAFVQAYKKQNLISTKNRIKDALAEIEMQLVDARKKLEASEAHLQKIKTDRNLSFIKGYNIDKKKLEDFNKQYLDSKIDRITAEVKWEKLQTMSEEAQANLISIDKHYDDLIILKNTLAEAQIQLASLHEEYEPGHPDVAAIEARVQRIREQVEAELQGIMNGMQIQYEILKERENNLASLLKDAKEEIYELDSSELEYIQVQREVDSDQELYIRLKQDYIKTLSLLEVPDQSVEVVNEASPALDYERIKPNTMRSVVVSGFTSWCMGIIIIVLFGYSERHLHRQIREKAYSVLTIIPNNVTHLMSLDRLSMVYDAFRILANKLFTLKIKEDVRTILITSGGAGEGKTTVALNLAAIMGDMGKKVLIVDYNIRKPEVPAFLELMVEPMIGIGHLDKYNNYKKLITPLVLPNVDLLPAGQDIDFEQLDQILTYERLSRLIDSVKHDYDFIVFDGPPIVGFGDCVMLAGLVDRVALVVSHKLYATDEYESIVQENLNSVNSALWGTILNNVNPEEDIFKYYYQIKKTK